MNFNIYFPSEDIAFGGGLQFLRALREYFSSDLNFNITHSPNLDNQIIIINGGYKAPSTYLNENEIVNLKKYGYTSLLEVLFNYTTFNSKISTYTERFKYNKAFDILLKLVSKKRPPRIIHRVDGFRSQIYNKESNNLLSIDNYPMDKIQMSCMNIADIVIFQSNFSLNIAKKLGYDKKNFKVIHNGVNQRLFFPDKNFSWNSSSKLKVISSSWSDNLHKGFNDIADFSEIEGVEMTFVGNWNKDVDAKNVKLLPPMRQSKLSENYRKNHVLLFPSINESCPNTVLEALSSGLPVFYKNSGGTPEICKDFGIPLEGDVKDNLEDMKLNYKDLRQKVLNSNSLFSVNRAGSLYKKILEKCLVK